LRLQEIGTDRQGDSYIPSQNLVCKGYIKKSNSEKSTIRISK